jgi:glutathione S-transferase
MSASPEGLPELFQFSFSHYNEKARWALDYKRVPHTRRTLLPGPHMATMLALTGRNTKTPALRTDERVISGSAQIIEWLERQHPEPPLYPKNDKERHEALRLQTWFDGEIGVRVRRAIFWDVLPDGAYLAGFMSEGFPPMARRLYRVGFPALRVVMKADMKITDAGAAEGRDRTKEALDFVAKAGGYLVGNKFSVADLTAAALLSVTVFPPEFPATPPEPVSPGFGKWLDRWKRHPGTKWVLDMYRKHRGTSAALASATAEEA